MTTSIDSKDFGATEPPRRWRTRQSEGVVDTDVAAAVVVFVVTAATATTLTVGQHAGTGIQTIWIRIGRAFSREGFRSKMSGDSGGAQRPFESKERPSRGRQFRIEDHVACQPSDIKKNTIE